MNRIDAKDIDQYISFFPAKVQDMLQEVRATIKKAAPDAQETISYSMPAFKLKGILVYFAGYDHHIGFYPTSSGIANFGEELAKYETSKGTVRFPLDRPLPLDLISQIVGFRVQENIQKAELKKKHRK